MIRVKGRYRNQVLELAEPLDLPEGAEVVVEGELVADDNRRQEALSSLSEGLKALASRAVGLPEDISLNHDHDLHGLPKR